MSIKIKSQNNTPLDKSRLKVKNIVLIFFFLITYYLLPITVFAQESSNSAQKSASPSGTLLEKINELKNEIASKAAKLKLETVKKIENKVFAGIIKEITEEQIILVTKNGEKIVLIDEFTEIETGTKKPFLKDLKIDDYMVALGDIDDKLNLAAKKIIKTKKEDDLKKIYWGKVESVVSNQIKIKTREKDLKITTSGKTKFYTGNEEILLSAIKKGQYLAVSGYLNDETLLAQFVYLIPSPRVIKINKEATSAAKL